MCLHIHYSESNGLLNVIFVALVKSKSFTVALVADLNTEKNLCNI